MDVTLLYIGGCPHWQIADERLREALVLAGRGDMHVRHRLVTTPEQAEAAGFRGSPSVLVDGRDPFAAPDAPVGLSCRVYVTEAGLAGAPTVHELLVALQ